MTDKEAAEIRELSLQVAAMTGELKNVSYRLDAGTKKFDTLVEASMKHGTDIASMKATCETTRTNCQRRLDEIAKQPTHRSTGEGQCQDNGRFAIDRELMKLIGIVSTIAAAIGAAISQSS